MKSQKISHIAALSGKSKATISRVLNNCPGVDNSIREEVMQVVCAHPDITAAPESPSDLCIILPDNPKFFWHDALEVASRTQIPKQVWVYSHMQKNTILHSYMDRLEASNASALIFAGTPDARLCERLEQFASGNHLLIQLCEYTPIRNSFYVGSEFYRDGFRLGRQLLSRQKDAIRHIAILERKDVVSCRERNRGFVDAFQDCGIRISYLEEPQKGSLYPAQLARMIAGCEMPVTHLFCASGCTVQACDALRKIKNHRIGYVGFECPPGTRKYRENGTVCALAVQNISKQTEKAISFAEAYLQTRTAPDRKYTYIPSRLLPVLQTPATEHN